MLNENDIPILEPTKEQFSIIHAIGKETVHKICSGQVVLSLAVAVKELVENAIDAGATLVEVKLREHGLEGIDVSDNGSGVEEHNLEGMTAKYHTSKLREFVDLQEVETFGFRGEALSSLCAVSNMTIVTRHKSTNVGIKIELDHEGNIKSRKSCARSVGTTVTLAKLFVTLPVRRRDFTRNIKREFNKVYQMLQSYCLVAKGVRIICSNQTAKNNKAIVMQTHGANDVLTNIAAVFGHKQVTSIVPIKSFSADEPLTIESLRQNDVADADNSIQVTSDDIDRINAGQFKLEGYVSTCSHGGGRSSKDRQFFYINDRPCEPKNISKVMNEIYHRYNMHQYPFIYLNVITARSDVDVNLTPDKRLLLVHNERILLIAIKQALLKTFGAIPATYTLQNSTVRSMLESNIDENVNEVGNDDATEDVSQFIPISSSQKFIRVLSQWKHTGTTIGTAPALSTKRKCIDEITARTAKLKKMQDYLNREYNGVDTNDECKIESYTSAYQSEEQRDYNDSVLNVDKLQMESTEYDNFVTNELSSHSETDIVGRTDCKVIGSNKLLKGYIETKPVDTEKDDDDDDDDMFSLNHIQLDIKSIELDDSASDSECAVAQICISLSEIEQNVKTEEQHLQEKRKRFGLRRLRFKSEITPSQNQDAEAELQKEITKDAFAQMNILGQFNLGFIITKLDGDLFIVDQHASDEKFNFETLQRITVLKNQPLAVPQTLEMTAVNEMILLNHLDVFEKNGFKFDINQNASATNKIRLLGKPCSKNWEFGKDDIDELIFMLQDAPEGTSCRPSRIRGMFASRACRKSVMIGQALNRATMKKLVTQMGQIDQPWNCPHGRPTMRHLINVDMLLGPMKADKQILI